MKNSFIHNLKARGQIFTGLIGDYVKVRPERVIFSPFSRTFPLEDRKYYIRGYTKRQFACTIRNSIRHIRTSRLPSSSSSFRGATRASNFSKIDFTWRRRDFGEIERISEEIREITSSLYFRKAMPRSDLRQAEELASKPFPTIDEIVHIGLPLDLNDPEVRKLQFKLNNAHIQFVADRITVANNLGQRSVHQLDHLDVPKQEEKN